MASNADTGTMKSPASLETPGPAVCRASYVHPGVVEAYLRGELARGRAAGGKGLSADEAWVRRLLRE